MKRTFLKVLPFAAALLLATSCSKDDNNSVDEIVNNNEQTEIVQKTIKTLTIKGKVNKSISKVTVDGTNLAFEGNEVFAFGSNTDDVYGTINFTDVDGSYTATINYTDETALSGNFSASLGTNPATISEPYDNLAAAVKNAYYTIDFTITQNNDGEYKLKSGDASDIVVNLQSAFIKALADNTEKLGGEDITVEKGKYYIVPVGKEMGESGSNTVAGKIYTIKAPDYLPGVFTVAVGKTVKFSKGNLQYHCTNQTWRFAENQWDYIGEANKNISSSYDGYIDLFGWGMWLSEQTPTKASTSGADYLSSVTSGGFSGASAFGSEWTTLTSDEWTYLFNTRSTTSKVLYAKAEVNGVNGVILLPDNWSSETYTLQNTNSISAAFTTNTINATNWSTLEAAGAVFLPAAGYRHGETVYYVGSNGRYWSGTANGTSGAYRVNFDSYDLTPASRNDRCRGFSVRLVRCMN